MAREGELELFRRGRGVIHALGNKPREQALPWVLRGCGSLSFGSRGGVRGEWERVSFLRVLGKGCILMPKCLSSISLAILARSSSQQ